MSYARFGYDGSDVYVYLDCGGFLRCCACALDGDENFESTDAMLAHLKLHEAAGHCVPAYVAVSLEDERAENDAFIRNGGRE